MAQVRMDAYSRTGQVENDIEGTGRRCGHCSEDLQLYHRPRCTLIDQNANHRSVRSEEEDYYFPTPQIGMQTRLSAKGKTLINLLGLLRFYWRRSPLNIQSGV